ncbi:MAG: PfkB family carbohydrate kinase [Ktedonobacterales bacterium]
MAQVSQAQAVPEFLVIGHVTRDLLPDGHWRLGGTVTFAVITAQRLGMRAAIVTSGPPDVIEALQRLAPDIPIATVPCPDATTFENIYKGSIRSQYLRGRATLLTLDHVPVAWRSAPVVLLAPLAQEVDPQLITSFPHSLVAATPQGWLRRWNDDGFVMPGALDAAVEAALPSLHALILSREDLLPPSGYEAIGHYTPAKADAQIAAWARVIPIVAVTRSANGALLLCQGHDPEAFPGYPAREVDPTGAGDVFATAFLCRLHTTGNPRAAADFANRVAAISVEHTGASGIPTQADVIARFG